MIGCACSTRHSATARDPGASGSAAGPRRKAAVALAVADALDSLVQARPASVVGCLPPGGNPGLARCARVAAEVPVTAVRPSQAWYTCSNIPYAMARGARWSGGQAGPTVWPPTLVP